MIEKMPARFTLIGAKHVSAPTYGYRVGEKDTPIFITYRKDHQLKNEMH